MYVMKIGSALALLVAACGETRNDVVENRQVPEAGPTTSDAGESYSGTGKVTTIAGDKVTISHGPIEGIGWPAMTMTFAAGSPEMVEGIRADDRVSFSFRQDGSVYTLTSISKQ